MQIEGQTDCLSYLHGGAVCVREHAGCRKIPDRQIQLAGKYRVVCLHCTVLHTHMRW